MPTLRILIADDHEAVRTLLRDIVESVPGWEVCAEAVNGEEAIAFSRELKPDVVILDLLMPGQSGLEATREIVKFAPDISVLLTTLYDFPALVEQARDAGAAGYFIKSESHHHLTVAVDNTIMSKPFYIGRP
jgi:DNA-binding NarL/FixJ family response regulator